jgi:hypothetical protein
MAGSNTPSPFSDALRKSIAQAIAENRINYLTLERETGVSRASIRRFVNGERSLRLDVADQLAAFFGLKILEEAIRSSSPNRGRCEMFDRMLPVTAKLLCARYAIVFADEEEAVLNQVGLRPRFETYRAWNGWKPHLWPLDILKPGLQVYLFNKNKRFRALVALYEIEKCSVFEFTLMTEFEDELKRISGQIARPKGNPASPIWWEKIDKRRREQNGAALHGYVFTAKLLDCLDPCLQLPGKFPLNGWCDLQAPNFGMRT